MPEKKMKNIKRELIEQKLNLVVEKLMNLGGPENEAELKDGGEAIGFFKRDFGIAEWDWPQGVGLYGLLKMMKIQGMMIIKHFCTSGSKEISQMDFRPEISIQQPRF